MQARGRGGDERKPHIELKQFRNRVINHTCFRALATYGNIGQKTETVFIPRARAGCYLGARAIYSYGRKSYGSMEKT